jgi:predicted sulfurtransferase
MPKRSPRESPHKSDRGTDPRVAESVLLYYHYVEMDEQQTKATREQQLLWCRELDLMGRIRASPEGLNGTLDGTNAHLAEYTKKMDSVYGEGVIDWKWATYPDSCERRFRSVSVKIKDEVVGMVLSEEERMKMLEAPGGKHLTATEWHEALQEDNDNLVLLDVRNYYETRVGYFKYGSAEEKKAVDPLTRSFSDFKHFVDKEVSQYKDKKVLMYCTGGVRCERASQYLKSKGVEDVYQLYGGIHTYQEQYPDGFFKGKNFVYDPRVAVGAGDVKEQQLRKQSCSENDASQENVCELGKLWSWFRLFPSFGDEAEKGNKHKDVGEVVGQCMICNVPHDDYHSPYDRGSDAQTRCSYCRVLCLVCKACKQDAAKKEEIRTLRCEMCLDTGRGEET